MEVPQRLVQRAVAPLHLDQVRWSLAIGHDEVDLAAVDVPEVPQIEIAPADVLLVVHPLQQVHGHQVLEAGGPVAHLDPVVVVVLLRLLDGAERRRAERLDAEDGVEPLENLQPAADGPVADLQVLAQRVHRQRRPHHVAQPNREQLDRADVGDPFEVTNLLFDEAHAVLARPALRCVPGVAHPGLGEAAEVEEPIQPGDVGDAELGDRQRVQAQQVVASLQGVAAVTVVVEPAAAGDENAGPVLAVVEALEKAAPPVELVQLVEDQHRRVRQAAAQDRVAVIRDVPAQIARRVREQAARQGGLAHLPGTRDEHHLPFQIAADLAGQIAPEECRHRCDASIFMHM